jgi:hypothetical protein
MSYSLESLITQSRQHLREFQPMYYKKLKASGELEAELKAVAQMTLDEMAGLPDDESEESLFQDDTWGVLEMMDAPFNHGDMD